MQVQAEYVWDFEVETNQVGMATLEWNASQLTTDLYLFDESLQQPVNMREVNTYTFDPQRSSKFKVYYGTSAKERMNPNRVLLGNAYPNPSSGQTYIPFSLPERKGTFEVQLDMFDPLGRKLATLIKGQFTSGFYQADWTPQEVEANGMYIYRLSVAADGNSEVLSGKVLIKK